MGGEDEIGFPLLIRVVHIPRIWLLGVLLVFRQKVLEQKHNELWEQHLNYAV